MGITTVSLKIRNPLKPEKVYEGEFLVDSGSQYTIVPESVWKKLGLEIKRKQKFALADGKIISRPIGNGLIEYQGIETANPIVLGQKGDSLLMGVVTWESLGLVLDPFQRKLYEAKVMM